MIVSRMTSTNYRSSRSTTTASSTSTDRTRTSFSKQIYTFSNPPRELQHRQSMQTMKYLRNNRLRQRVASAPEENSPRSILNQQKPSSANESLTPRSRDDEYFSHRTNQQQRNSFNALMKEQERSKVPKAVQKRRIILLFRRLPTSTPPLTSPRQFNNASPTMKTDQTTLETNILHNQHEKKTNDEAQYHLNHSPSPRTENPFRFIEQAEIADSKQLATILANIQSFDDWIPCSTNETISPRNEKKIFDPNKYEYVATNSMDITTFKLSPRTLKPDEELAAKSRFTQNYRSEMLSSTNAQMPPLMASIVAENNTNTMSVNTSTDKTFTFRFNSTTMKRPNTFDPIESIPSTIDGEEIQLCFDEILKCFYDPTTGTYYELTSS